MKRGPISAIASMMIARIVVATIPMRRPRRFGLPLTDAVRTSRRPHRAEPRFASHTDRDEPGIRTRAHGSGATLATDVFDADVRQAVRRTSASSVTPGSDLTGR